MSMSGTRRIRALEVVSEMMAMRRESIALSFGLRCILTAAIQWEVPYRQGILSGRCIQTATFMSSSGRRIADCADAACLFFSAGPHAVSRLPSFCPDACSEMPLLSRIPVSNALQRSTQQRSILQHDMSVHCHLWALAQALAGECDV